jgi:hypothetical protein
MMGLVTPAGAFEIGARGYYWFPSLTADLRMDDALADISVIPFPFLDIHAGYRVMRLKTDGISDVYGDLKFFGVPTQPRLSVSNYYT